MRTILGLSNVSFGLNPAARQVLNSVFLHECSDAGLDAAIVHASKILPLNRIDDEARRVCLDLIYDRRSDDYDPLTVLLGLYEGVSTSSAATSSLDDLELERPRCAGASSTARASGSRATSTPRWPRAWRHSTS